LTKSEEELISDEASDNCVRSPNPILDENLFPNLKIGDYFRRKILFSFCFVKPLFAKGNQFFLFSGAVD
jgi:hypothetical protein